jgi:uncharacterized membrane protein
MFNFSCFSVKSSINVTSHSKALMTMFIKCYEIHVIWFEMNVMKLKYSKHSLNIRTLIFGMFFLNMTYFGESFLVNIYWHNDILQQFLGSNLIFSTLKQNISKQTIT